MTKPYYEIEWEARDRIVHSRLVGFFTLELAEQFCAAMVTLIRGLPPGPFDILGDLTEHPVQSRDVHQRMVALSPELIAMGCGLSAAIMTESIIAKMQFERTASGDSAFFSTEAAARAWLAERRKTAGD